jgi:ankyrin repeat protein
MSQLLDCLCPNNVAGCRACGVRAREQWTAFAAQNPQATPGQLIEQAIKQDRAEVVLGVLQNTDVDINQVCDPQRYGSVSPLMTALHAGNKQIVALIAGQPRFDLAQSLPKYERWSWVRSASLEVLQLYLDIPGSDVNQTDGNGKTLLHEVVYDLGSQDKLRDLISRHGIIVDAKQVDGTSPLYRAGLAGNAEAFGRLLDHGADINNRNNDNRWTILICAVAEKRIAIAEQALRCPGIEINAADDIANTALHMAAEQCRTRMIELLLQHSEIQINLKNHMGWTPLAKAAFAGHAEVVRRLLARPDLEVNFVDQDRQTPLFHAASTGTLETVRQLLADPRTNTAISNRPERHTALDMAVALKFTEIAELIRRQEGGTDELSPRDPYIEREVQPRTVAFIRPPRK